MLIHPALAGVGRLAELQLKIYWLGGGGNRGIKDLIHPPSQSPMGEGGLDMFLFIEIKSKTSWG